MQTLKLTKKYETHPEYKNSGVDWFGKIPKNWDVLKGKFVFQNKKEINHGMKNDNVLSLTMNGVINRDSSNNEGLLPSDYQSFQIFEKNDLVFKLIDLENYKTSRVGIVHEKGIMSPVYIRLETKKDYLPKYFYYLYYRLYLEGIYNFLGSGVRSSLSPTDLMKLEVVIPDLNEQKLVVDLLDKKTKEIDQIIEKKQKLIELLREKRTAVINHAVTKGLDSKVELFESGVDWIGKIPKGWNTVPLKYKVSIQEGPGIMAEDFRDSGVPLLRIRNLKNGVVDLNGCNYLDDKKVNTKWKHFMLLDGDILISGSASSGIVSEVDKNSVGSIAYTGLIRIRSNKIEKEYLKSLLNSHYFNEQVDLQKTGTAMQHYGPTHLKKVIISLPPNDQQEEIGQYIKNKLEGYDKAINLVEKSVETLQEFKSSLISNVVTGKVKI